MGVIPNEKIAYFTAILRWGLLKLCSLNHALRANLGLKNYTNKRDLQ